MIILKKVYIVNILPLLNQEVYQYYYDRIGTCRQQKADKLVSYLDKARSVGAGAVLRFAVEDATGCNYDELSLRVGKNGKPYIEGDPFYFSLAHSGDYAVCAISDSPVGVDIEQDRELSEAFKARFSHSILEWTKKEAKGKLTGKGFFDDSPMECYVFTHHRSDGYIITVCSDESFDDLLYYHLPFPTL